MKSSTIKGWAKTIEAAVEKAIAELDELASTIEQALDEFEAEISVIGDSQLYVEIIADVADIDATLQRATDAMSRAGLVPGVQVLKYPDGGRSRSFSESRIVLHVRPRDGP